MENKKTIFEIINEIMKKFENNFSRMDDIFSDDVNLFIDKDKEGGQYTTEKGDGFIKEEYESEDGSIKFTSYTYTGERPESLNNIFDPFGVFSEPNNNDKLGYLQYKLDNALDNENYEEAAKLRDEIKTLEG